MCYTHCMQTLTSQRFGQKTEKWSMPTGAPQFRNSNLCDGGNGSFASTGIADIGPGYVLQVINRKPRGNLGLERCLCTEGLITYFP